MKRINFYARLSSFAVAIMATAAVASAQGYYDDDIYFDPSKSKKEQPKASRQSQQPQQQPSMQYYYDGANYVPWTGVGDFQAADSYLPAAGSTRDVDEYNRHYSGSDLTTDSISLQQFEEMSASMANTRNLARFHDSDAAKEAYTENEMVYQDSQDLYNQGYSAGYNAGTANSITTVNVNVDPFWGYSSWRWPYYSSWGWPYYGNWGWNSWYYPYYTYPWGWDWGPSWAWGPSWSWGWGPSWAWAPHHHHYYNNPPGATRPNRPMNNGYGSNRPGTSHRGSIADSNGRRPSTGTSVGNTRPSTSRPGYSTPIGRPSTAGSSSGSYSRGRAGYTQTPSQPTNRGSYNNSQPRPSSTSSGSYSRGRSSSSSGSYSSGRSSGGFSGGSHRSSGSGGGGGRRGR